MRQLETTLHLELILKVTTVWRNKASVRKIETGLDFAKAAMNKLGADAEKGKVRAAFLKPNGSSTDKLSVNVSFANLKATEAHS